MAYIQLIAKFLGFLVDNIVFYKSSNNVILTEGLGGCLKPQYFSKVEDREGRPLLLP